MAFEVRQNPTLFSRKIEEISRVRQKRASRRTNFSVETPQIKDEG